MTEKTLGQILESIFHTIPKLSNSNDWERAAKEFIAEHESRKRQSIDTSPWDEHFLAEDSEGSWIKVERYKNPFGETNTVINRRSGKWFTATCWQTLPTPPKHEN